MLDTPIRSEAVNWSHRLFTLESLVAQIIDEMVKNNATLATNPYSRHANNVAKCEPS